MSSAHKWNDVRILLKECTSLKNAGYNTYFVVEGDSKDEKGIHIVGCGEQPVSRKERIRTFSDKIYRTALSLDCDVYHIHDPELLPFALKLKEKGKKVIFDSHEDVSGQILSKYWIPSVFRWFISKVYWWYESWAVRKIDAVVTATPHIATLFAKRHPVVEVVNNYPMLNDIIFQEKIFSERGKNVCYAGGINAIRGERIMVDAVDGLSGIKLILAGPRDEGGANYERENVIYTGKFTRKEVNEIYGNCRAGLILFQPEPNHIKAKPNKMFEYMAAGLPIICSDFPLWREIVEGCGCGICVDPTDSNAVREACKYLVGNPDIAQEMGKRGYEAVIKQYNWKNEEEKLLKLYKKVLMS